MEPGFDPRGLVTFRVPAKVPGLLPDQSWQVWDAALAELASVPGVEAWGGTSNVPFQPTYWAPWVRLSGQGPEVRETTARYAITPGYLDAVGTRILAGRDFGPQDGPDGPWVVLVNEAFVRRQMLGRGPGPGPQDALAAAVGRQLLFSGDEGRTVQIVGVVEDVIQERAEEGPLPAVYVPYTQASWPFVQVAVRSDRPLAALIPDLRKAMARFSPYAPVMELSAMEDRMAATRTDPRFHSVLIGFFAALALLLASAGLDGSLSHAVGRRRRELGIRVALGAARRGVVALVVGQSLRVTLAGLALGLAGALALRRFLNGFLFGITTTDPLTYLSVAGVLMGVAAVAAFFPARRATGVDPVEVLKAD